MIQLAVATTFLLSGCASAEADRTPRPLKVCLLSGSWEYDSNTSLETFAKYLRDEYGAECTLLKATDPKKRDDLPGLEALGNCDVALFFTRRLELDGEQLERLKAYCRSGKPIVALRTASHGFQKWLEFDKLVLGGNYHNHFKAGPTLTASVAPGAEAHPVLAGVGELKSDASLYKTAPLADDCKLLLSGSTPDSNGAQPLAWTRTHNGGRVFYAALGAPTDFENVAFRRLVTNALFWAAKREPAPK